MEAGSSKAKQEIIHDADEYANELIVGFKFHPTEEELIKYYLTRRINNQVIPIDIFQEVNIYNFTPQQLKEKYKSYEGIWYFFTTRDRKYPNGSRPSRTTLDAYGYWKATGADKVIFDGNGLTIGYKKVLIFYVGKSPKGVKTNWSMHEYRLQLKEQNYSNGLEPVLCKVYEKIKKAKSDDEDKNEETANIKSIENYEKKKRRARSYDEEKSEDTTNITHTANSSKHTDKKDPLSNESFSNTEESAFTHSPYLTVRCHGSYQSFNNYHSRPPHGYEQPYQSFSESYESFNGNYNPYPPHGYHVGPSQSFNDYYHEPYLPYLTDNFNAGPSFPNNFNAGPSFPNNFYVGPSFPNNFNVEPSSCNYVESIMPSKSNMLTESTDRYQHAYQQQTTASPKPEFIEPAVDDVDQYLVSNNVHNDFPPSSSG